MINISKSFQKFVNKLPFLGKLLLFFIIVIIIRTLFNCFYPVNREYFGNPKSCTYYYMEKCGHCKEFSPVWDDFSNNYKGDIKLRKLEMKEAGNELELYKINSFPTVLLVDDEGNTKVFDGPRTKDGLADFLS